MNTRSSFVIFEQALIHYIFESFGISSRNGSILASDNFKNESALIHSVEGMSERAHLIEHTSKSPHI